MKNIIAFLFAIFFANTVFCQNTTAKIEGKHVKIVQIRDASDNPIMLPKFGEKNLLIFYMDPDHYNQNKEFRENLEKNQINSSNIHSFGVINLKDAPLMPNSLVRSIARKKAEDTNSTIYTDPDHLLRDAWGLGDVNNQFVLIFVNINSVIEFYRAGEFSKDDIAQFFKVINKYR